MHVITHYSWLSMPFLCSRLPACHSSLPFPIKLFSCQKGTDMAWRAGGDTQLSHVCWLSWNRVDRNTLMWTTFPGGKIDEKTNKSRRWWTEGEWKWMEMRCKDVLMSSSSSGRQITVKGAGDRGPTERESDTSDCGGISGMHCEEQVLLWL